MAFARALSAVGALRWLLLLLVLTGCAIEPQPEREPVRSLLEIRREHVVVQQWDLSCGAAALATVLNHHFDDMVSEREIALDLMDRPEYIQNPILIRARHGFSLLDLKRYVEGRGYEGVGYGQLTVDDLLERAPIIVPVRLLGYNHFVVFRGAWGDRVLLADPAWGNRTMPIGEFEDAWLDYPVFGKVGFAVVARNGREPTDRLAPSPHHYLVLS